MYPTSPPLSLPLHCFQPCQQQPKVSGCVFWFLFHLTVKCIGTSFSVSLKHCFPVLIFFPRRWLLLLIRCELLFCSFHSWCWSLGYFSRFLLFKKKKICQTLSLKCCLFSWLQLSSGSDDCQITSPDFPSGFLTQTSLASGWFQ